MVAKALFQRHHHSKQREKRKAQQYGKDMRDYLNFFFFLKRQQYLLCLFVCFLVTLSYVRIYGTGFF